MRLQPNLSVGKFVEEMRKTGVLGAGRVGRAAELIVDMFSVPEYTVFLSLAGPMVPAGLRHVITEIIDQEYVNVVVSTGANIVHDMVEAIGFRHYVGSFMAEDKKLRQEGYGRIGDIYVSQEAFQGLEKWLEKILTDIPNLEKRPVSSYKLLYEIGKRITDSNSILATAAKKEIPIFCPNLADCIAGFQMCFISQGNGIGLNPLLDTAKISEIVMDAQKTGIIILGGGWPKHYTLFANTLREGVDCAVQITMDRPEPGGLSGASLDEAISWSKVRSKGRTVSVVSDATIIFPLLIAAVMNRLSSTSSSLTA
ncbi:MAG: deoxyhypusine synthase [Candidatus Bathyarchaeota archaeon]|jgi:deoxyhypusine synthase